MTWSDLEPLLDALCGLWELAAPPASTRGIVWHEALRRTLYAEDRAVLRLRRIQLDVLYQDPADTLPDDVLAILDEQAVTITADPDISYDPDYASMRCILQIEVL